MTIIIIVSSVLALGFVGLLWVVAQGLSGEL